MMENQIELEVENIVVVKAEPIEEIDSPFVIRRRSTRKRQREIKEEDEKYAEDQQKPKAVKYRERFPDPRKRIRDPNLLGKINQFLEDVGTDPNDISFTDTFPVEKVIRYEPRLPEDLDAPKPKTFTLPDTFSHSSSAFSESFESDVDIEGLDDLCCEANAESDTKNEAENPNGLEGNEESNLSEVINVKKQDEEEVIGESSDIDIEAENQDKLEANGKIDIKTEIEDPCSLDGNGESSVVNEVERQNERKVLEESNIKIEIHNPAGDLKANGEVDIKTETEDPSGLEGNGESSVVIEVEQHNEQEVLLTECNIKIEIDYSDKMETNSESSVGIKLYDHLETLERSEIKIEVEDEDVLESIESPVIIEVENQDGTEINGEATQQDDFEPVEVYNAAVIDQDRHEMKLIQGDGKKEDSSSSNHL